MLKIENVEVMGWEHAVRSTRGESDSYESSVDDVKEKQ